MGFFFLLIFAILPFESSAPEDGSALNGKQTLPSPSVNFEVIDFSPGMKEKLRSDSSWTLGRVNGAVSGPSVQKDSGHPSTRLTDAPWARHGGSWPSPEQGRLGGKRFLLAFVWQSEVRKTKCFLSALPSAVVGNAAKLQHREQSQSWHKHSSSLNEFAISRKGCKLKRR